MRTAYINGKFYVEENHFQQAILVQDDRIVKVSTNQEILSESYDRMIDLKGKTVIPGLNDAHMHCVNYAKTKLIVNLVGCRSKKEVFKRCQNYLDKHQDCSMILARGYNEDLFEEQVNLSKEELNQFCYDRPVVMIRVCGHSCICNDVALEQLQMESSDGFLYEEDCGKAARLFQYPKHQLKQAINETIAEAISFGITSIQSQDITNFEKDQSLLDLIEEIYQDDAHCLRWHLQCEFQNVESLEKILQEQRYCLNTSSKKLTLGPIKLFKDGSLGAKTALLKEPYVNEPENKGIDVLPLGELERYVKLAQQYHVQLITHAIGDLAIEETVLAYQKHMDDQNTNRHCLNHCQITDISLMQKIAKNHILIAYQPIFLEYDIHMVFQRVKKDLALSSYAYQTAWQLQIPISFSTDCPVEPLNPFFNIHCAVNRNDLENSFTGSFNPKEKVSVSQAIDAYTIGSSYLQFMEQEKGRIKEHYLADLVVLDRDIFTCDQRQLKEIRPVATLIDGKLLYNRDFL